MEKDKFTVEFSDYPILYQCSDKSARRYQRYYLISIRSYLIILITITVCNFYLNNQPFAAIISSCLFLLLIFLSIFIAYKKFDKTWYISRSIAESVKTITWRYMMKAEPFDMDDNKIVNSKFTQTIKKIFEENRFFGDVFQSTTDDFDTFKTITNKMLAIRSLEVDQRLELYKKIRIDDQLQWYNHNSRYNRKMYNFYFFILIIINVFAFLFMLLKFTKSLITIFPTDIFIISASSILTWIQVKKYQELATSYSLTTHEIIFIKSMIEIIQNDQDLSDLVKDTENVFSREHTQWLARRDS